MPLDDTTNHTTARRGSGWVLEREIKNEQEVLALFLRALRRRKSTGRRH